MYGMTVDRYDVFDAGCTCGGVLDHLPVCVSFVQGEEDPRSAFPAEETRRYRRSILDGIDPASQRPLDAAGWLAAIELSDERHVQSMLVAAHYDGQDTEEGLRGIGGGTAAARRRDSVRAAADAAQWHVSLVQAVPDSAALHWSQLAASRARAVVKALTEPHEMALKRSPLGVLHTTGVQAVTEDVVAVEFPAQMAIDHGNAQQPTVGALALRKCLARWMHIVWVLHPSPTQAGSGRPGSIDSAVLVIARAHRDPPAQRPPTRFLQVESFPRSPDELGDMTAELSAAASGDGSEWTAAAVEWPVDRIVAGSWPTLCISSSELAEIAWQLRSGSLLVTEPLGHRGRFRPVDQRAQSRAQRDGGVVEIGAPTGIVALSGGATGFLPNGTTKRADSGGPPAWRLLLTPELPPSNERVSAVAWFRSDAASPDSPPPSHPHEAAQHPGWVKAMAMWFNSSLGLLGILATAAPRGRMEFSIDQMWLREMAVPTLDEDGQARLAEAHDQLGQRVLLPFGDGPNDETRIAIDEAVCDATGCDPELMSRVRVLLAEEPLLQNRGRTRAEQSSRDLAEAETPTSSPTDAADSAAHTALELPAQPQGPVPAAASEHIGTAGEDTEAEQPASRQPTDAPQSRRIGDWTSWSAAAVLLLLLPVSVVCSLLLLFPIALFWPHVYWFAAAYYALGLVVLIPGVEDAYWGLISPNAREPRQHENDRLKPAWARVLSNSGRADGARYRLRVLETDEINAMAGGGHQVFITTAALGVMPDEVLPGVLAHELGHHVGLHPIVLCLEVWFMRPIIWAEAAAIGLSNICSAIYGAVRGIAILGILVGIVTAAFMALAGVLRAVTWIAFATLRLVGRGAEYRADRYAAQIGFGRELAAFLEHLAAYETPDGHAEKRTLTDAISSTHPPTRERIRRLRSQLR